jgi:hypothetical protein
MAVTAPSVPATGVAVTNPTGQWVSVTIAANGATMTNVSVNGTTVGTGAGSYQLPPGGTISMAYTVATPTWTWANPIDLGYTPGYYAENTQAEFSGWNPYTALPYAQHAALGVSGLATGVSN